MDLAPRTDPRHAFAVMDALRALAAGIVVVSHVRDLLMSDYSEAVGGAAMRAFYFVTGLGHAGVVIFFVLSGFWITKSVVRRTPIEASFWPGFLIDRLSRLWLVLIPVLLLGGLMDWFGAKLLHAAIYEGHSGAASLGAPITLSLSALLGNAVFLQTLLVPIFGSNGPLWSLAYEFWYYLWFPALWMLARRRFSPWLLTWGVALISPGLLIGFASWLCGSLLYFLVEQARHRSCAKTVGVAVLAAGVLFTMVMLAVIRVHHWWWLDPVLALAFATFLLGLCLTNQKLPGIRLLAAYGARSSFSLYALHFPVATLVAALLVDHGRFPPDARSATIVVGVLAALTAVSFFFSLATEAHTGRARAFLTRLLPVAAGGRRRTTAPDPSFPQEDMTARLNEAN